ncbi:SDR family NAD(P)-dependent oxidoreductase [Mycolicibacterium sp.]|uniref:SDR family NAD(P)-dependent oxidoreductase n=1 Tax=Mycolicibacterium sp. TaxID=2320850 RepID=UPI001A18DE86|nr:SDR family NAD(P)-dependent oxidoreductase [Mycolicibacterium sp.]MBJ7336388.1 SDR family oxidoreductase [Mycolicibacterium sp.]
MTTPVRGLGGRVALITGAGRGIGAAHAVAFAAAGATVVVNDTGVDLDGADPDPLVAERLAASIRAAGGHALPDVSDVSDFAGAAAVVQRAVDEFGRLDILVNNAGIISTTTDVAALSEAELRRTLDVHVVGTIGTIRAAFPIMAAQRYGCIINTTSEAALSTSMATGMAYAAAKSSVWGITMAAARQGAECGITVNALSPGALTRMSKPFLAEAGMPSGLDLSPEQIARVAVALCSADSRHVTGKVIHTAAGFVREYVMTRVDDSDLVNDVMSLLAQAEMRRTGATPYLGVHSTR